MNHKAPCQVKTVKASEYYYKKRERKDERSRDCANILRNLMYKMGGQQNLVQYNKAKSEILKSICILPS